VTVAILTCDRDPSYLAGTLASLGPDVETRLFRDEWPRELPATQRLTLSFRRALLESPDDSLIVEDDVEFRPDWCALLAAAIARSRELCGGRFFLACYCPHVLVGDRVSRYRESMFFGTQAQYVPPEMRASLADYIARWLTETTVDLLIAEWCRAEDVTLLATVPSLVQHVGRVSSLGDAFHRSPMWSD
jgi:hypothetical protein